MPAIDCHENHHIIDIENDGGGILTGTVDSDTVSAPALYMKTIGTGEAGYFEVDNPSSSDPVALYATDNSEGITFKAVKTGYEGHAGYFETNNRDNCHDVVRVENQSNGAGIDVHMANTAPQNNGIEILKSNSGQGLIINHYGDGLPFYIMSGPENPHDCMYAESQGLTGHVAEFFTYTYLNNDPSLYVRNFGSGEAGYFINGYTKNEDPVGYFKTYGTGEAGYFTIDNVGNDDPALYATTNGTGACIKGSRSSGVGEAGYFNNSNSSNSDPTLFASTNSAAWAVFGTSSSDYGRAGLFYNTSLNTPNPALEARSNGMGEAGYFYCTHADNANAALLAQNNGTGPSVKGFTTHGGIAGYFQSTSVGSTSPALYATTSGLGPCVKGYTTSSSATAGHFEIENAANSEPALYASTNGTGEAGYFDGDVTVTGDITVHEYIRADDDSGLLFATNDGWVGFGMSDNGCVGINDNGGTSFISAGMAEVWNMLMVTDIVYCTDTMYADALNTGQGDNLLYAMDQDVQTTDQVKFDGVHVGGTSAPGADNLVVDGNANVGSFTMAAGASNGYVLTSDGSGNGTWQALADGGSGGCSPNSSRDNCKNIRELITDFSKILSAQPKSFIDKTTNGQCYGYIADDFIDSGLSELVINQDGKPTSIDRDLVSVYLLEVIKELHAKNNALEARIAALEAAAR